MRILHVGQSLDPAHGGPSVSAPSQACAQAARGDSSAYLYYRFPTLAKNATPPHLASLPGAHAVDFIQLPLADNFEQLTARGAKRWLLDNINNYDIVHLHGMWRPLLAAAAAAATRNHVPYLLQPHGMLDVWSMRQKGLKKRLAWKLLWQGISERAAFVHVLNEGEAEGVRQCGVRAPLVTIGNGIFRKQLDEVDSMPSDPLDTPPYILFLSRLHAKKGLDILAEAFRIYRARGGQARLRVVGPDEGARADFATAIERAGLTTQVDIEEPVYGPAKYSLMRSAQCFCLPSYQEGFSVALLEAAACAVPLVISTECHFPEIEQVGAGSVLPLDPNAFAGALLHFTSSENSADRHQAGINGHTLVRNHFTWEAIAEQLDTCYQDATSGNHRALQTT